MTSPAPSPAGLAGAPPRTAASLALGWTLASMAVALVYVALSAATDSPVALALAPLWAAYVVGHAAALGLAVGLLLALGQSLRRGPLLATALLTAAAIAVCVLLVPAEVDLLAGRLVSRFGLTPAVWKWGVTFGLAAAIPLAWLTGLWLARRPWAIVLVVVALLAATWLNANFLRRSNPAAHLLLAWCPTALAAGWLWAGGLGWPGRSRRPKGWLLLATAAAVAAVAIPPGNALRLGLSSSPGAVLFPYLAPLYPPSTDGWSAATAAVPPEDDEAARMAAWLADRSNAPPVPPTAGVTRAEAPIVLLVVIDAMRADLREHQSARTWFPTFMGLADQSVVFTEARSPGVQTVYALASIFTGRYYSQLYWTERGTSGIWPHEDPTPRFPEVLRDHGVVTGAWVPTVWLQNDFGVARGFAEGGYVQGGESIGNAATHWSAGRFVVEPMLARLAQIGDEAFFGYIHFIDPHEPYNSAPPRRGGFRGYVAEISAVDESLGRIVALLDERDLWHRTTLIVTADHGEAFGEHGTRFHATTLYDELMRVPLLIRSPDLAPREVATPVTLLDLGPTVLDLFGLATPGHNMGQSLLPTLFGVGPPPSRPIGAEGRRMQALLLPDGLKVIANNRHQTVEVYDLGVDPLEANNLATAAGSWEAAAQLAREFFAAHALRREGYELPDRP